MIGFTQVLVEGDTPHSDYFSPTLTIRAAREPGGFDFSVPVFDIGNLPPEGGEARFKGGPGGPAVVMDGDGDGLMEILIGLPAQIWEYRPDGTFERTFMDNDPEWHPDYISQTGGTYAAGDFDGDGRLDLVTPMIRPYELGGITNHAVARVLENRGNDQYELVSRHTLRIMNFNFVAVGDVNGDGRPEFLAGGPNFHGVCWYYALFTAVGDDQYVRVWERSFLYGGNRLTGMVDMGDTDGDGHAELAISMGDVIHVYEFDADFQSRRILELRSCDGCPDQTVHLRDLDGDGVAEMVVGAARFRHGPQDPEGIRIFKRVGGRGR